MMGHAAACDMLMFGRKITATEAKRLGLVTEVFPAETFEGEAWGRVAAAASLPPQSLRAIKGVMRAANAKLLHEVGDN